MKRNIILALMVLLPSRFGSADSSRSDKTLPSASPAASGDVGIAANFIRSEGLSPSQEVSLRQVVTEAYRITDDILRRSKRVSDADRSAIRKDARRRAVGFLDEAQMKSYDRCDWGLLFYRPGPEGTMTARTLNRFIREAEDSLARAKAK